MSFPIGTPPGASAGAPHVTGRPDPQAAAPVTGSSFARVYELQEARRRRAVELPPITGDRIPAEVWDEVDAAARLFDHLKREGRQVMFDSDRLTGRVVASLLGPDGTTTPLSLTHAVDPHTAPMSTPTSVLAAYSRTDGASAYGRTGETGT